MKKIIFGLVSACILLISSCSQDSSINPGGAWVFKTITYNPLGCHADSSKLVSTNTGASMTLVFNNTGTLPAANASFMVVDTTPLPGQVEVLATVGTANYRSTGGNGTQTVTVTVSNLDSRITASGTAIELRNLATATDSAGMTFTVIQMP